MFVIAWAPSEDRNLLDFDYEQGGETQNLSEEVEGGSGEERDRVEPTLHAGGVTNGIGSIGRRKGTVSSPTLRHQPSLIGLSPAQVISIYCQLNLY